LRGCRKTEHQPIDLKYNNKTRSDERRGIIAACSWTVDRIKIISEWPKQEHLAHILDTDLQGGGCGYNVAVDSRKLDSTLPVEAIGLIGSDQDGEFLRSRVSDHGIDTSQFATVDGLTTSYTDVMSVRGSGKRTFFHHPGAHDHITPDHFDLSRCKGRILHLGLLGVHARMDNPWQQHANGWVAVLQQAQAYGIHTNLELVSVEPQKIRRTATPCLPHLDTLIINDFELSALADYPTMDNEGTVLIDSAIEAAKRILDYSTTHGGTLSLVVMHSPSVAIAVSIDGNTYSRESYPVHQDNVASTVGAGDAFAAGMLYGIHEEWTIERALELAHATAATSLLSSNTVGSVDTVDRCLSIAAGLKLPR